MNQNLAAEARAKTTRAYGMGIALFTGAMSTLAMFLWLVHHIK